MRHTIFTTTIPMLTLLQEASTTFACLFQYVGFCYQLTPSDLYSFLQSTLPFMFHNFHVLLIIQ